MAGRAETSRENGKKGGRPRGAKSQSTLEKAAAREYTRQRITARLGPLVDAWLALAEGFKYLVVRDKVTGKFLRVARHNERLKPDEEIIEVWEKAPSSQAIRDLLDRALDKPKEQSLDMNVAMDWDKRIARIRAAPASGWGHGQVMRTALWQSVKRAFPTLTDKDVDQVLQDEANLEARLVSSGMPLHQAREIARAETFEGVDPFAGDDQYGPPR